MTERRYERTGIIIEESICSEGVDGVRRTGLVTSKGKTLLGVDDWVVHRWG